MACVTANMCSFQPEVSDKVDKQGPVFNCPFLLVAVNGDPDVVGSRATCLQRVFVPFESPVSP